MNQYSVTVMQLILFRNSTVICNFIQQQHSCQENFLVIFSYKSMVSFFFLIFIGVQLLYNILLVSAIQQSESAIRIHISPLFWISFPFKSPQSDEQSSLCYTVGSHQLSILYIVSTVYICQSQSPNSSYPAISPLVSF